jgi:hypothetical protein
MSYKGYGLVLAVMVSTTYSGHNFLSSSHYRRHLGGKIPPSIELTCPAIGTRVDLDVPAADEVNIDKAYHMFSRRNIIDTVRKSLASSCGSHEIASRDWNYVVERRIATGTTLELAWNLEAKLDWVWKEEDVMGQPRPWAVLCGLAMQQVNIMGDS